MANLSKTTQDHEEIRRWAEERGGTPSHVKDTGSGEDIGILRIDFPGYSGEGSLEPISWEQWFEKFDERNLALLYQEETAGGERSNFNKIVSAEAAEANEHAEGRKAGGPSGRGSSGRGGSKKSGGKSAARSGGKPAVKTDAKTASKKGGAQVAAKKGGASTKKASAATKSAATKKAVPIKKAAAKKATAKKAVKKAGAKKAPAKKTPTKKSGAKKTGRR
jgi:hypothetical protein